MQAEELKGRLIGARAFKVINLYKNFSAPFQLKKKFTTSGRILSKVADVQARVTSNGGELMIGLEDEGEISWVLYEPDLFFYGGKTEGDPNSKFIFVDQQNIDRLAEKNSLLNTLTAPVKKYAIIGFAVLAAILLLKRKS